MQNRITRTGATTFVSNANDSFVGKSVEIYGEWSHGEVEALAVLLRPDQNVVEVGANIGAHTVFLARDVCPAGTVYAFEPRRLVFQMLCANLAVNSLANVHAFQMALGRERQVLREGALPLEGNGATNLGGHALGSLPGEAETIEVRPLDEMLASLPRIALLKADVEGHEQAVLEGARQLIARDRPILYLENDRPAESPALIRAGMELDYLMWWHTVPLFRPQNLARTQANIFGNVHSFNMLCLPRENGPRVNGLQPVTGPDQHPLKR